MHPLAEDVEFLEHFGVKGMQWGVRKDRQSRGVSGKVDREAAKDAKESARAKMYYGQGAGTRRKLINKSVEAKKARDPNYAKAFDHHLAKQDLSTHATKAKSERKRTDRKDTVKKGLGQIARSRTGEMGTKAAFTAIAVGGAAYLRSPRGQAMMRKTSANVKIFLNSGKAKKTQDFLVDFFNKQI